MASTFLKLTENKRKNNNFWIISKTKAQIEKVHEQIVCRIKFYACSIDIGKNRPQTIFLSRKGWPPEHKVELTAAQRELN